MKFLRFPVFLFLPIMAMCFALPSCKNNPTSPSLPPPAIPTLGSLLTEVSYSGYYDTTTIIVDSATTVTDPNANGSTILKLEESASGQTDSTYESIEPNGNVALEGTPWGAPGTFEVLPFATMAPLNSSYTGVAGLVMISAAGNGAGTSFFLDGTGYPTDSVTVTVVNASDTDRFHYTYIPSLGLICIENYQPGIAGVQPTSQWLIGYIPK